MHNNKGKHFFITLVVLVAALFLVVIIASCCGHYHLNAATCLKLLVVKPFGGTGNWTDLDESVMYGLRLPRIIGAIMVGACLSMSGASYQSVFQNPLVSPDILGVSSGACVGAALAILLHLPKTLIMLFAFGFGIITVLLTVTIPKLLKSDSNIMLVLSGIVVGGLTGSAMGIIKYIADPRDELPQITFWMMGSLDGMSYNVILFALAPICICIFILIRMSWWIDIISMGERMHKRSVQTSAGSALSRFSAQLC